MIILGISEQHESHACIVRDGKLLACIAEERLSRIKSDSGFPKKSIDTLLDHFKIKKNDIDFVAFSSSSKSVWHNVLKKHALFDVKDWIEECEQYWKPLLIQEKKSTSRFKFNKYFLKNKKFNFNQDLYYDLYQKIEISPKRDWWNLGWKARTNTVSELYQIDKSKCSEHRHEDCHKIYGYFSSPFVGEDALVFTLEGGGDDSSATVSIVNGNGNITELWSSNEVMIGRLYAYITLILGMKPGQHEYKVMGLAPYGNEKYSREIVKIFEKINIVDGIQIKNLKNFKDLYFSMIDELKYYRFDNIAFALQKYLEDMVIKWVSNCIKKFNINKIIVSGGVGQNIKLAKALADSFGFKNIWHPPIAGDGSLGVGAAWIKSNQERKKPIPLNNIYLGKSYEEKEIEKSLKNLKQDKFLILKNVMPKQIAHWLADGKICARFSGRMEFGQRALGNRSIIADPRNYHNIEKINDKIKYRDFWMPFTPTILDIDAPKILKNYNNVKSAYMTIAFDLNDIYKDKIPAVIHPSDKTVRPQILEKNKNPDYYNLIKEFKKISGLGVLLNTSFNLHGEPIVECPDDAIRTFLKSDLDILLFDKICIIRKNNGII